MQRFNILLPLLVGCFVTAMQAQTSAPKLDPALKEGRSLLVRSLDVRRRIQSWTIGTRWQGHWRTDRRNDSRRAFCRVPMDGKGRYRRDARTGDRQVRPGDQELCD